ncbi:MAG: nucleoside triphosphate pyrophosphohydrolase [Ilumatobacter sp.]|nr:nucleoside triphosphate pyrophosphohydrolase [Ilumatobacter sp.]
MTARIIVVGLGPGDDRYVDDHTRRTIADATHRYVRTARHPTAHLVEPATSFDDVYERADTFDEVYVAIADALTEAAHVHREILYAVPGSPLVLERTVRELRARAASDGQLTVEVRPAMSFLDLVWARLGIDPIESGVRLVDGHDFSAAAAGDHGPLLVAHTHANWVLSEIKLAVEGATGDEPVTILQALGTPAERIVETRWSELDRTLDADHLTALYVPHLATPVGRGYVRFHELTRTLREQCPWDIEQTHQTLIPHLLEETYEVIDALNALDDPGGDRDADLIEELGDLLYQIEFHATIAEQEGRFTIADVTDGIHDKLVRRHPHVFGETSVAGTAEVVANWDDIKRAEKARTSVFDGIARSMPSLAYAQQLGTKAAKVGFDWPDVAGAFPKIAEERAELADAMANGSPDDVRMELGDLLFAVVNVARHLGVDAELALRDASDKFRTRFERVETLARDRAIDLRSAGLPVLDALWDDVKRG